MFISWPGRKETKGKYKSIFKENRQEVKKSNIWIKARLMFKWLNNWFIKMLKHQTYVPWTPSAEVGGRSIFIFSYKFCCLISAAQFPLHPSWDCNRKDTKQTTKTNIMQFKMFSQWMRLLEEIFPSIKASISALLMLFVFVHSCHVSHLKYDHVICHEWFGLCW